MAVAVCRRRHTRPFGVEIIARLGQPLACGHLRPEGLTLRALGIIVNCVWSLARPGRHACELLIWVCQTIGENDTREVEHLKPTNGLVNEDENENMMCRC